MFEDFRKKVFLFIEPSKYTGYVTPYNVFMGVIIFISVLPIMVKHDSSWLIWIDLVSTVIFVIDYILRWLTADIKFKEPGAKSFLRYPLQRMAVIDLISIIPGFFYINGFHLHRIFRVLRTFRFLRIIRYSKSTSLIIRALKKQKNSLYAVVIMAVEYVFVCALIIFNVEPQTFHTFFDAVYWSTVSLTTVGYGDIYPVSTAGQLMAMLPFGTGVKLGEVTGEQLLAALEHGVSGGKGQGPELLQVSGLRYTVDPSRPAGSRVSKAEFTEPSGKTVPLKLNRRYRIVMNSFIAGGGDGYGMLKEAKPLSLKPVTDEELLEHYLRKRSTVTAPAAGRIVYR